MALSYPIRELPAPVIPALDKSRKRAPG